jgi:Ala-tRNA(Pro) deacylase
MAIAITLKKYLEDNDLSYEVVDHPYAATSLDVASKAHVPANKLVKAIVLEDEGGYVIAVCPASSKLQLGTLYHQINRRLHLADEYELADLIGDCVLGAVPPLGELYGADVVMDDALLNEDDVYIEAGDHEELLHLDADNFQRLMHHAERASFCKPV